MTYILTAALSSAYALFLSTERGKEWVDRNTTLAVVLGVGGVLLSLRVTLDGSTWRRVLGAFAAAGAPLIVRGIARRLFL